MLFTIKHRFTAAILFQLECGSLKLCVTAAVTAGADLRGADLRGADLRGADLRGADLRGADMGGADLGGADLRGADLRGADMGGHKVNGDIGLIFAGNPNNWPAFGFVDQETRSLRVCVGCQNMEITEGRAYWSSETHPERERRYEVLAALDYIEAVAKLRGWLAELV